MRFALVTKDGKPQFVEGIAAATWLIRSGHYATLAVSANSYNGDPKTGGIQTEKYRMRPADGFVTLLHAQP